LLRLRLKEKSGGKPAFPTLETPMLKACALPESLSI